MRLFLEYSHEEVSLPRKECLPLYIFEKKTYQYPNQLKYIWSGDIKPKPTFYSGLFYFYSLLEWPLEKWKRESWLEENRASLGSRRKQGGIQTRSSSCFAPAEPPGDYRGGAGVEWEAVRGARWRQWTLVGVDHIGGRQAQRRDNWCGKHLLASGVQGADGGGVDSQRLEANACHLCV